MPMPVITKEISMKIKEVTYSKFNDIYDTRPKQEILSFDKLITKLSKPDILSKKNDASLISLSTYGERANEKGSLNHLGNIKEIGGIILDIDNKNEVVNSFEDIKDKLKGINYFAYTTFNHTKERHKFRVIIPFIKAISPDFYSCVFEYFNSIFNNDIDNASNNANQFYFVPSYSEDNKNNHLSEHDATGSFFDPIAVGITKKTITKDKYINNDVKKIESNIKVSDLDQNINVDSNEIALDSETIHIIKTGDTKKCNGDHSAVYFGVICQLLAHGCDDITIASILFKPEYKISEWYEYKGLKFLEDDIERAIIKNNDTRYHYNIKPHYKSKDILDKKQAQNKLNKCVKKAIKSKTKVIAIKGTTGLGKTQGIVNAVSKNRDKRFEIYVTTHKLAEEIYDSLKKEDKNISSIIIGGRSHEMNGETLCEKHGLANVVARKGGNVFSSMCTNPKTQPCHKYDKCEYINQYKKRYRVKIYTHEHLKLPRTFLDNDYPDYVIIDESFFRTMIETYENIPVDIIQYIKHRKLANQIHYALIKGYPLLTYLRKKFRAELLPTIKQTIKKTAPNIPLITPETSEIEAKKALKNINMEGQKLKILLENLHSELIEFPKREHSQSVRYHENMIRFVNRHEITRFIIPEEEFSPENGTTDNNIEARQIPILLIDADYEKEIAQVFFPSIRSWTIYAQLNIDVVQVNSTTNATSRFMLDDDKSHLNEIQFVIDNICENEEVLIIGPSRVVGNDNTSTQSLLKLPKNCKFEHFGNLRGIDEYKDYNMVIIIGRLEYPTPVVEDYAAALWWDTPEELLLSQKLTSEVRGYSYKYGKMGVNVSVHPDWQVQLIMEHLREREILQAIGRIRAVHSDVTKSVYILSNLVLDLEVDHLTSMKDLSNDGHKLEHLMNSYDSVMSLSPQILFERHPKVFTTKNAVTKTCNRFKDSICKINGLTPLEKRGRSNWFSTLYADTCCFVTYKVVNAKHKNLTAMVKKGVSSAKVKSELKALHGGKHIKIRKFVY